MVFLVKQRFSVMHLVVKSTHLTATKKVKRLYGEVSCQRGPNIKLFTGCSESYRWSIMLRSFAGSVKSEKFKKFFEKLRRNLLELGSSRGYCIFDNAKTHVSVDYGNVFGSLEIKRLTKYSQFLNMAEKAISDWKSKINQALSVQETTFICHRKTYAEEEASHSTGYKRSSKSFEVPKIL